MLVNSDLVARTRTAEQRVREIERELEEAKADYHHAIHALHVHGASVREIASSLGLSYQRVHQIVAAPRPWHQWWRKNVRRDMACSFCRKTQNEAAKLIAGPAVYICDTCVANAHRAIVEEARTAEGTSIERRETSARFRCSFCGRAANARRVIVGVPDARVCAECLELCERILSERDTARA